MPRSTMPTDATPQTSPNPAISGSGSGMGAGGAAGPGPIGGVQSGTINDAAQGARTGDAPDPSLGSGMAVHGSGNRMGDAATGGPAKPEPGITDAAAEPFELPYRVIASPRQQR
jgi:hypothetical protein